MLKALIVDDEPYCCEVIATLLEDYCPDVAVKAICYNGIEALSAIEKYTPDLVFLDVEMPRMNGFEMLEQVPAVNFDIIFTTSYDHYALKAIRFSAIDYLLKPVDGEELQKAVQKVKQRLHRPMAQQMEILLQHLHQPSTPIRKIALPTMEGLQMVPIDTIISCESDDNYTHLLLKNGKKLVVTRSLKEIEETLAQHTFLRVHRCFLVNLNEIEKYIKGEGGYMIMSDGSTVNVSKNRKELLLQKLRPFSY